jgi:hypothetical protein
MFCDLKYDKFSQAVWNESSDKTLYDSILTKCLIFIVLLLALAPIHHRNLTTAQAVVQMLRQFATGTTSTPRLLILKFSMELW